MSLTNAQILDILVESEDRLYSDVERVSDSDYFVNAEDSIFAVVFKIRSAIDK